MTTAEPGSAGVTVVPTTGSDDLPEFATVMRGYDRGQVDDYVARLKDFVADAERRAELAERAAAEATRRVESLTAELRQVSDRPATPATPYEGLGERIESMLRLAAEEADAMRAAAQGDIARMHDEARRHHEEQVQDAERELDQVRQRRDDVVHELRRVQEALATLGLRPQAADDPYPQEPTAPHAVVIPEG